MKLMVLVKQKSQGSCTVTNNVLVALHSYVSLRPRVRKITPPPPPEIKNEFGPHSFGEVFIVIYTDRKCINACEIIGSHPHY